MEFQRFDYPGEGLKREELNGDPFEQFRGWLDEAKTFEQPEANAMTLSTATLDGKPSIRVVLLKGIDHGLIFFTNYLSRKGAEISLNPQAALSFYWRTLFRQVTVEGKVRKISRKESEKYFRTRPRRAQISALVSEQGLEIESRPELEAKHAEIERRFAGEKIPLPPFWGGYRLVPNRFEFWQGRPNRLHDRFEYLKKGKNWVIKRVSP